MSKSRRINENYTFIQAYNLYCKAQKAEKDDYIRALNLYRQAISLIDSILERFPSSALALKIAQRKFRLGLSTYAKINKKIDKLRQSAWRQEMLEILHDCARNIKQIEICCEKLADLAKLFMLNNQKERALVIVSEAADLADRIENPEMRSRILSSIALKYADIGEFERALTLSAYFPERMDQIRLFTGLGQVYYETKLRDRARQLFISAIDLLEQTVEPEIRMTGIAWTAYKLAESCEYHWAFEVAESIQDPETRLAIMHQIVEHLVVSGKYVNIVEISKKIENPEIRAELAVSLVMKHASEGFFSQAREAADSIFMPILKARAFLAIASEYKDRSVWQIACDLVDDAIKLVDAIPAVPEKILVLTQSATVLLKFNQESRIKELLQRALNLVITFKTVQHSSEFVSFLLKKCLELGQVELANDLLEQITDVSVRNLAVVEIAARHALVDNFVLARKGIASIKDTICRLRGYLRIVAVNPENRNYRDKLQLLNEVAAGIPPECSPDESDQILAECAFLLLKAERFHAALQLQEKIVSDANRDELLWKLADLKFSSDHLEEGVEVIRLIKNQDRRIGRMIELGVRIFNGDYPTATFTASDFLPVAFSFWLDEKEKFEADPQR
ncbi:MAG: hypothetical protein KKB51_02435 [Candidatus Riflebacteria bacterium]|nr:hypothetical protein [Candidatus Riflebacteria bacterium]